MSARRLIVMNLILVSFALLTPSLPAHALVQSAAPAQPGAVAGPAKAATAQPAPDDGKSSFGEPLYVNGKRITDRQIKLHLIYGACARMVDLAKINLIVEDQISRTAIENAESEIKKRETEKPFASADERKKALDAEIQKQKSRAHEKYNVSDEEVEKEFNATVADFKQKYPVLDVPAEVSRAFRTVDWYRKELRQSLIFDNVFLPPNPDEWPVVTKEAVRADSGDILVEDAKTSYETRKKAAEKNGGVFPKEDVIYVNMMRQIVRDAVFGLVDFKYASDGIADNLCLWADTNGDGKPELTITIDEMWNKVSDTVAQTEIDDAKQWYITSTATRDRLEKEGVLLSRDDCGKAMAALLKQFEGSTLNLEQLATKTFYFPSLESYKDYYCMLESFKHMLEPKLQAGPAGDLAQPLREHFDKANRIMGLGQVDVEVLLVSAMDIPHFQWKKDGWAWAEKTSKEIKAKIDANTQAFNEQMAKKNEAKAKGEEYKPDQPVLDSYRFWSQMIDDHSDYWDPPTPEGGKGSDVGMKRKGRFGPRYRNDLISFIGESYYSCWATGTAITDYVFFDQAEGTVAGPFKGPLGYYLTRVVRRTPPTRPLNLSEPKHVELLRDDYLRVAFMQYAKEAVAQATVKGF
jgi:hypothetical protein